MMEVIRAGSIGRERCRHKTGPLVQVFNLLWQTINSKRAELRVFFADLTKLDKFWIGPPGPNFSILSQT
jgi:hypothetical protein